MNNFKRLFCLLMALAMVFALAACGGEESTGNATEQTKQAKKTIVGEWMAVSDCSDVMSEVFYELLGLELDLEDFNIELYVTFEEDGTFEAETKADFENGVEVLVDEVWDELVATATESGLSPAEAEELLESQGVTKDALLEQIDLESVMEECEKEFSGEWVLDGDELYMAEENPEDAEPIIIEFDGGDEITVTEMDASELGLGEITLPLEFERV